MVAFVFAALALGLVVLVGPLLRAGRGRAPADVPGAVSTQDAPITRGEAPADAAPAPAAEVGLEARMETQAGGAAPGPRLRLRVVDAYDGAPLAGARATLHDRAEPSTRWTDAEGRCELPVLDPPANALLVVEHAGHLALRAKVPWEGSEKIELERAATLRARVVEAQSGEPVPAAWLEAEPVDCEGCPAARVVADADGRLELPGLALGRVLDLRLGAEGFATLALEIVLPPASPAGVEHELRLPRGVRVHGRVRDLVSGEPLAGARVGELVSDAAGRFDGWLAPLPGGSELAFDVQAEGFVLLAIRGPVGDFGRELDLSLPRVAWIAGDVRDELGQPVPGASVTFWSGKEDAGAPGRSLLPELPSGWRRDLTTPSTVTDASGRFRLAVLPWAPTGNLSADAREHERCSHAWGSTEAPGGVQEVSLRLPRTLGPPRIFGQVLLNGHPTGMDARVRWRGPTRSGDALATPEDGFELVVEPGLLELEAEFTAFPGRVSLPLGVTLGPNASRVVYPDVRLEELVISGTVRDPSGAGFAGVSLWASSPWPGSARREGSTFDATTRSGEDGSYRLRVPVLGVPFQVQASAGGAEGVRAGVEAGASGVDFVLARGQSLLLLVRDGRTGEVLTPAEFTLFLDGGEAGFQPLDTLSERPDPGGYHEYALAEEHVDLLVLPQEHLRALAPGIRTGVARVGEEPLRLELVLQPGVALELELAGEPLSDEHELYLVEEALHGALFPSHYEEPLELYQKRRRVNFDAHGRARLEGLAPGPLRFRLFPDDRLVTPALFRLDPGLPPLEVKLEPR